MKWKKIFVKWKSCKKSKTAQATQFFLTVCSVDVFFAKKNTYNLNYNLQRPVIHAEAYYSDESHKKMWLYVMWMSMYMYVKISD